MPGFAAKRQREVLRCPEIALSWPWHAVQLVLTGRAPGLLRSRTTEDGNREIVRLDRAPSESMVAELERYKDSLADFSRSYLFDAEWAPRALHDAQRTGEAVKLPRGKHVRDELPEAGVLLEVLEHIVRELAPAELESKRSRDKTWEGALAATRLRLEGVALDPAARVHLHRARRYLDAAVNRTIQPRHTEHDPLEPSDRADYAQVVRGEDKEVARLLAERRKRDAAASEAPRRR